MNISGMRSHELVPGRAMLTVIPWLKETSLKALAVYAPNEPQTNQYFWESIQSKMRCLPGQEFMLGDFNIVEDALDRLPPPLPKADPPGPASTLFNLKTHLKLKDGWRSENPGTLLYTYAQSACLGGRIQAFTCQGAKLDVFHLSTATLHI